MTDEPTVFAHRRKNLTSHRQHQTVPPADPWSRGPAVLSFASSPNGNVRAVSASDALAADSFPTKIGTR